MRERAEKASSGNSKQIEMNVYIECLFTLNIYQIQSDFSLINSICALYKVLKNKKYRQKKKDIVAKSIIPIFS